MGRCRPDPMKCRPLDLPNLKFNTPPVLWIQSPLLWIQSPVLVLIQLDLLATQTFSLGAKQFYTGVSTKMSLNKQDYPSGIKIWSQIAIETQACCILVLSLIISQFYHELKKKLSYKSQLYEDQVMIPPNPVQSVTCVSTNRKIEPEPPKLFETNPQDRSILAMYVDVVWMLL